MKSVACMQANHRTTSKKYLYISVDHDHYPGILFNLISEEVLCSNSVKIRWLLCP